MCVLDQFPKYHMKNLLDFNAKIRRDVFNQQMVVRVHMKLVTIMGLQQ
jgi:hypothetical protein